MVITAVICSPLVLRCELEHRPWTQARLFSGEATSISDSVSRASQGDPNGTSASKDRAEAARPSVDELLRSVCFCTERTREHGRLTSASRTTGAPCPKTWGDHRGRRLSGPSMFLVPPPSASGRAPRLSGTPGIVWVVDTYVTSYNVSLGDRRWLNARFHIQVSSPHCLRSEV